MTAPGVYDAIPEDQYHADKGSLSVSGAKKLLPPSCPALFRYEQDNGQPHKAAYDFGHAAHSLVLGVGASVAVADFADYKTKAAREWRDAAYADGETPMLQHEWHQVLAMAAAIKAHPVASRLFDPTAGKPEQSMYRVDPDTGVTLRGRLDWLPNPTGDRLVIPDYKTTAGKLDDASIAKAVASFRYDMQHAWYVDTARALNLADEVLFIFVFQMKDAPHLVRIVELDEQAERIGRADNRRAIDVYAECKRTDTWSSWSDDIDLISLPKWATFDKEAA